MRRFLQTRVNRVSMNRAKGHCDKHSWTLRSYMKSTEAIQKKCYGEIDDIITVLKQKDFMVLFPDKIPQ